MILLRNKIIFPLHFVKFGAHQKMFKTKVEIVMRPIFYVVYQI